MTDISAGCQRFVMARTIDGIGQHAAHRFENLACA
jgi:hypothetical protein